jgi:peroxiredoxin
MCNLRVHQMIQRYPEFQRMGLDVVAVFESPVASIHAHVGKQDPPFPVIADPDAVLYDLYGVEESADKVQRTIARPETAGIIRLAAEAGFRLAHEEGANMNRMPADFLIGPDGLVRLAHYAEFVTDHLPFAEIKACLDADVLTA